MAKEVAQLLQSWLPSHPPADNASQQRILELEAELARVKSDNAQTPPTTTETPEQASTPIGRALQGQPSASTSFDPSCLLVSPGSVNQWLVDNQPSSLTETQYKKWLKDLKLPQHKQDTLEKQLEKVSTWWHNQQDDAVKTIQRASVAMGIDPCKHKNASTDEIVLRVMTVAMLMNS
jgi:type II secretory pathway component PulJ